MAIFFSDPDPQQAADEEQQILSNASYGATEDEREQNLTRAKNYALGYRIAGAGALVCAYIVLMAHSNMIMYLVLMAFPIVGILLMRSGNGLITLLGSKNTGYASAETGFAGPIFGLAFFAFKQYDFIDISQLIIPGVVIGAAFFYVVYSYTLKRLKVELKLQIAIALLFAAAYGFGSAAVVNCVFDQTKPQYYVSEITNMRMHEGSKSTYYHLYLSSWGPDKLSGKVAVSQSLYSVVRPGTHVRVTLRKGVLGMPWYYLEKP